jgi:FkbM family methyltransferase
MLTMDRYAARRRLLRPVTAVRRRRAGDLNPYTRAVYEAHDYRPAMLRFFEATRADPDLLFDIDLAEGDVLLDVGAFVGDWTARMLRDAPRVQVLAFEPEPSALERFGERIDDPRVVLLPYGLGGRTRRERLVLGGPGSSVFTQPGDFGSTDIELRDVADVLASHDVERVKVAKVNIEGGEFELIDRLHETGWLARIDTMIVQFHEFGPDAHRARRRNRRQLAETHHCSWNYSWVNERWDARGGSG